jgi:hypothetical protein
MGRHNLPLIALLFLVVQTDGAAAQDSLKVRKDAPAPGPRITEYLQYQLNQAWQFDEARAVRLAGIQNESDVVRYQSGLREKMLAMLGGLPSGNTPLNARITGTIRMSGYRIEKLIFESLPGYHVTALLYVPDSPAGRKPAALVPCGHSTNGKILYQYLCHRLAKLGYVALCWDPIGQGERSQFWDAGRSQSRYNLVCGEHAVLGNLAYLAGANLARWEIWDGMRALDYLLTLPEVDPARISITGTSGGGFQAAHIGALDTRINVVMPSCYITSLPMRMGNRIFKDPDSDPEQDLAGMVSNGVDHTGLLALVYPRPLFVAAAVEDYFPIEGVRKSFREISGLYERLGRPDRIAKAEGYHGHQYSPGNIKAAFNFMNRFNGLPPLETLPAEEKLPDAQLLCTRTGQVRLDFPDGKSLMELIRDYYEEHKDKRTDAISARYRNEGYPGIEGWKVEPLKSFALRNKISWEAAGSFSREGLRIDRYLLHHSGVLSVPLLQISKAESAGAKALLWFSLEGKVNEAEWPEVKKFVEAGFQVLSFDFRGLGEDLMRHTTVSVDAAKLPPKKIEDSAYDPLDSVPANYVYNALLNGRPYFFQMIEDGEIVVRFAREKLGLREISVAGHGEAAVLARAMSESLPGVSLLPAQVRPEYPWGQFVEHKQERWPIQLLLPGGAYIK